jgi:hypothetical protein
MTREGAARRPGNSNQKKIQMIRCFLVWWKPTIASIFIAGTD